MIKQALLMIGLCFIASAKNVCACEEQRRKYEKEGNMYYTRGNGYAFVGAMFLALPVVMPTPLGVGYQIADVLRSVVPLCYACYYWHHGRVVSEKGKGQNSNLLWGTASIIGGFIAGVLILKAIEARTK